MKIVRTKYYTTSTGAGRILAIDNLGNRKSIPYPYELSGIAVHLAAVKALCQKIGINPIITEIETNKPGYLFSLETQNDK